MLKEIHIHYSLWEPLKKPVLFLINYELKIGDGAEANIGANCFLCLDSNRTLILSALDFMSSISSMADFIPETHSSATNHLNMQSRVKMLFVCLLVFIAR